MQEFYQDTAQILGIFSHMNSILELFCFYDLFNRINLAQDCKSLGFAYCEQNDKWHLLSLVTNF